MFKCFFTKICITLLLITESVFAETYGVFELLQKAYENNSSIKSQMSIVQAEEALIAAKTTLDDPMVGFSTLDRGSETTYGVISQKIRFPIKYYYQNQAQKNKKLAEDTRLDIEKFKVRKNVIELYYGIFSLQKIIQLVEANMQAVREFSRVAERKYAAGQARQGDSMKAHFELTHLELDLIRYKQQEEALQEKLKSVVNDDSLGRLQFGDFELEVPELNLQSLLVSKEELKKSLTNNALQLRTSKYVLDEARSRSTLSKWEFAPDFQLQYQKRLSGEPEDSDIFMVQMSVPFWFWKKTGEATAATAQRMAQEYRLQGQTDELLAKINDLKGRVQTSEKTLKIYKTSLIPQAQGAYSSSKAAYRANKTSFLDLLDSERSLFRVKTGYYQSMQLFVSTLVTLEAELGYEVSKFVNHERSGS
ncbi:MAG: TolC family protein [Bdellovibrionales bacterium]